MNNRLRGSRRALTKKVTSINFYVDQATQIQAIMESTGSTKEAPLVRQLVDEALAARRRKSVQQVEGQPPVQTQDITETLRTIQTLLLKLIRQDVTALRVQDIELALLQEILAEANAGRRFAWNRLEVPALREAGVQASEIQARLSAETNQAKDYAYGLAEEIRKRQQAQTKQTKQGNGSDQLPFENG